MLDRRTRCVLSGFDRFLDCRYCLVEFDDHALARAARFGHSMSAIAQAVVRNLGHESARFGTAHIDCR
jgi:hypothetical protein